MNPFERDIKQFILKALLRAQDQPINDDTLKQVVRSAFSHVAITEADLNQWIRDLKHAGIIAGTSDDVFGTMWCLSLSGKMKAQQLK
jgi:hypothetical protein